MQDEATDAHAQAQWPTISPQSNGKILLIMRIPLAYTLTGWLLGAVALSLTGLGVMTAWNLREGFSTYLQARDVESLDRFVAIVENRLQGDEGLLSKGRPDMAAMLRELAVSEGLPADLEPDAGRPVPPPARGPRPPPREDGPPGGAPPPDERLGSRLALFRPDGERWAGPTLAGGDEPLIEREVRLRGSLIALVRMRPVKRAPEAHEVRFLRSQYVGILSVASILMMLALSGGWWLSRSLSRPLVAVRDATARIAAGEFDVRLVPESDNEVGDVVRHVNDMANSLARIDGARRRWIADLSHELRTPLTALRGSLEAVLDNVRPLRREALGSMLEDTLRLGALVDDLHLLAMADLKALPCRFAPIDAVALVKRVYNRYESRSALMQLSLRLPADLPPRLDVRWDEGRIEQVLVNLLDNSLRYTDAPGSIGIGLSADSRRVTLWVEDSAPGVAADDIARVFDPLFRADPARGRDSGGSGLGLAICAAIVTAHDGSISARPSSLGGMHITLMLPRRVSIPGEP